MSGDATRRTEQGGGAGRYTLNCEEPSFSLLIYTEALEDKTAVTTVGLFVRAREFSAAHGITRIHRVFSDDGANDRAKDFTHAVEALTDRHQGIRPYTPRHNGMVERYNRLLADELLYARPYDNEQARRGAIRV